MEGPTNRHASISTSGTLASSSCDKPVEYIGGVQPKIHFNLIQTLGMVFSITSPPLSIGLYLSLTIGLGGFPFYIWGFLCAVIFQLIACFAVAELASAIPHSSGPAFWVQYLAPAKYSQFLGYLVGWLTVAAWWFVSVANNLYLAQMTIGVAMALNPGYNPPEWQYYLVYCAWALALFVVNLPRAFKVLPHLLTAGAIIINVSAIYLLVTLLVRATPKPSAEQVFVKVINHSGWSNQVAFFLNLLPGIATVNGFDSITHITDELPNPGKQVPQVMIGYGILSAFFGFAMTIVYSFSATNPQKLLNAYGHQPLIQLIFDSTRSTALAIIGCTCVLVSIYLGAVAAFTSWNRLYWSFAREGGLPFSPAMSKLSSEDSLPLNALFTNLLLVVALGSIQIGSLTALNAIIGGAVMCLTTSFVLIFGLALWRGRDFLSKDRWLNLGYFGMSIQVITLVWDIFISTWLCFPLYRPVTLAYMNWTSVIAAGVVVISVLYWLVFRRTIRHV